ncbi:hypothetical protein ACFFMM_24035 [Micromonospora chaiyaphumensis]|uniref:Secreted protein n=1 Tax=Micromonospora chaiyaphumensis TaxID=307119 RepID=A0A1C4UTE3_9ACTN|nr:hypothetical protein [Micromonospora chaiyaphumensis]SCE74958.1 hypothetical protein GA0070214_101996 [Micromonospora chaiyaphumensis]
MALRHHLRIGTTAVLAAALALSLPQQATATSGTWGGTDQIPTSPCATGKVESIDAAGTLHGWVDPCATTPAGAAYAILYYPSGQLSGGALYRYGPTGTAEPFAEPVPVPADDGEYSAYCLGISPGFMMPGSLYRCLLVTRSGGQLVSRPLSYKDPILVTDGGDGPGNCATCLRPPPN